VGIAVFVNSEFFELDGGHGVQDSAEDAAITPRQGSSATILLADLARSVIEVTDPQQLELFAEVTDRWAAGFAPGARRGRLGGSIGSGISAALTSELIYPLLIGALSPVLGNAVQTGWRRWRRPKPVPDVPSVVVTLDAGQFEAVKAACVSHGMALGLSKAKATVLAEAVHSALRQAADAHETPPPAT
jgi:hypothetical protein